MADINWMDLNEFVNEGFLQEVNRQFFHPLGLALAVSYSDGKAVGLAGLWDYRDDPEGMIFGEELAKSKTFNEKASRVKEMFESKRAVREEKFGWILLRTI